MNIAKNEVSSLQDALKPVVLVTGSAGFIGSNFVRKLLSAGECKVIGYDSLSYAGNMESIQDLLELPNHHFIHGDITDSKLLHKTLNQFHPDIIVNFAAESHVDRSIEDPGPFIQSNIIGVYELLEAAKNYYNKLTTEKKKKFRFVQVSTDEVFGDLEEEGFFSEESNYNPSSPYSASKAAADHLVHAYHRTYGIPTLITNCSNNYGPYQYPEKLIPVIIANAKNGKKIPIYGDGKNIRDWLYVEDHCDAIISVIEKGIVGEKYCVGSNCEKTNIDIALTVCEILDSIYPDSPNYPHRSLIQFIGDRAGHDRRYAIDASKLNQKLDWYAKEDFVSGLRKTIVWYLENTEWCEVVQKNTSQHMDEKKLA